jgi:hypothetical protein
MKYHSLDKGLNHYTQQRKTQKNVDNFHDMGRIQTRDSCVQA